jgi:hypothetical protein
MIEIHLLATEVLGVTLPHLKTMLTIFSISKSIRPTLRTEVKVLACSSTTFILQENPKS